MAINDSQMPEPVAEVRQLYLNLMKRSLMNLIYGGDLNLINSRDRYVTDSVTGEKYFVKGQPSSIGEKLSGSIWPSVAHTMIGAFRLNNLQFCIEDVLKKNIPGDLIETGVWRGGACIFMRAILKAYGITDRQVWVADSFQGLPLADSKRYPQDVKYNLLHEQAALAVSLEEVTNNFQRYDLLDEQVHFLPGWFKDTLPTARIEKLALLRLDGDLYESTIQALDNLYPKLSPGGYIIVDDYGALEVCAQAVHDYRKRYQITEKIEDIDGNGVYWKKESQP